MPATNGIGAKPIQCVVPSETPHHFKRRMAREEMRESLREASKAARGTCRKGKGKGQSKGKSKGKGTDGGVGEGGKGKGDGKGKDTSWVMRARDEEDAFALANWVDRELRYFDEVQLAGFTQSMLQYWTECCEHLSEAGLEPIHVIGSAESFVLEALKAVQSDWLDESDKYFADPSGYTCVSHASS
eukprot:TRINITY_DN36143_c0_g1_i1.p1 TRINITY_DN36143_c0_g1~~TRINITY_DN36143_c0_g1_i1.p1  ORF type:complete len:215 (+),score=32.31 TRINITY_DN36143_c0_g1_i1:88-645(+)